MGALSELHLTVVTVPLAHAPAFIDILDAEHPLLWRRRGAGLVGYGCALKLNLNNATRFDDAASAWKEITDAATVTDEVNLHGTGLVAFASFSFAEKSHMASVLIIPRVVIGRRDGVTWVTTITPAGEKAWSAEIPSIAPLGEPAVVSFAPGQQTEDGYRASVVDASTRITRGEVSKVVLARDLTGVIPDGSDIRPMIGALAASYPDCWTFAIDGLIGSSPETLVRVLEGTVDARVLAGTAARGIDPQSDLDAASALATNTKDLDEHAFAVRSVIDELEPYATHVTLGESPFTLRLANLWHLATDITGDLRDGATALEVIAALHPTAAVAGTPRAEALSVITALEPFDRGRYAGPVGWIGANGDGEWAIALRCVQVDGQKVTAYAGCGIMANSDPDAELRETKMKFRPVVDALSPVE